MDFQTKVMIPEPAFQIGYHSHIFLIGSCFVENIGAQLSYFRFPVEINPCGIVYNPLSAADSLRLLIDRRTFGEEDLMRINGQWVSLHHHGSFSDAESSVCLERINARLSQAADFLRKTDLLVVTWGTSWVYRYKPTGEIVANCHKLPDASFERFRLTPEEIVREYVLLTDQLRKINSRLKILFTVSPIRHWKDGAHGNQLSKAVLLLAIDELQSKVENVCYFPAYEIVMDELRDYRFYTEDMFHISPLAVAYIWDCFRDNYIEDISKRWMKQVEKINKMLQHRPFSPDSDAYRQLQQRIRREIEEIEHTTCIRFNL